MIPGINQPKDPRIGIRSRRRHHGQLPVIRNPPPSAWRPLSGNPAIPLVGEDLIPVRVLEAELRVTHLFFGRGR